MDARLSVQGQFQMIHYITMQLNYNMNLCKIILSLSMNQTYIHECELFCHYHSLNTN